MTRSEKLSYIKNLSHEFDLINESFGNQVITFIEFYRTGEGTRVDRDNGHVNRSKKYITGVICEMFGDKIEIIPSKENDKVVEVSIIVDYYNEPNSKTWKCENYCGIADEKDFLFNIIFKHYFES